MILRMMGRRIKRTILNNRLLALTIINTLSARFSAHDMRLLMQVLRYEAFIEGRRDWSTLRTRLAKQYPKDLLIRVVLPGKKKP